MSYYYTYYLGYIKDGKIYPYGPFNKEGYLESILSKSASYASDLHNRFYVLNDLKVDNSLYEALLTKDCIESCKKADKPWTEEEIAEYKRVFNCDPEPKKLKSLEEAYAEAIDIEYLPVNELPEGNLIKEGYVIASQIGNPEYEEEYYPVLDGHIYAEKLKTASILGDIPEKDCEGNEFPKLSEYVYHKWIDQSSEEYEAWILQMMIDTFYDYSKKNLVLIKTEG